VTVPPYVYVAAPYSSNPAHNTNRAMAVTAELLDAGLVPFCPHWTLFQDTFRPRPYEDWLKFDLAWLARCDAVLRLPGVSPGADREVAEARRLNLPVFYTIENLLKWAEGKVAP
jgi:hypothetical protein